MTFWAYMLHCRGGYFYVGHTDDLDVRMAQHQYGEVSGFAAEHRPVELVWSQEFVTREEAKTAEKQIKGWSRAKKMAVIRGDWSDISRLAKGKGSPSTSSGKSGVGDGAEKGKDSPSTGSGKSEVEEGVAQKTDYPELVEGLSLLCHPTTPSLAVTSITAGLRRSSRSQVQIEFEVQGDMDSLRLSAPTAPLRRDGLWQTTCFEAFLLHRGGPAYLELNFSPSSQWAAYGFGSYRDTNRTDAKLSVPPSIDLPLRRANRLIVSATLHLPPNLHPTRLAFSAIIEEKDGTKSYWALRHPPGAPDFHHPDCFALTLEAPDLV